MMTRGDRGQRRMTGEALASPAPIADDAQHAARLMPGVEMSCIATACAERASQTRLLAQALSKSSDVLICTQGKPEGLG